VKNWPSVFLHYSSPFQRRPILITFRNGETLLVPKNYLFEAIAETLLLNVYRFNESSTPRVVVDVGASIGDFVLFASRFGPRVYAYEPDSESFKFLRTNVLSNGRQVVLFNAPADRSTLDVILERYREPEIDFLKMDCEGCEYDLLLSCAVNTLSRIRAISIEVHRCKKGAPQQIVLSLKTMGFQVDLRERFGLGPYILAWRPSATKPIVVT